MKTKTVLVIFLGILTNLIFAQSRVTTTIRGKNSTKCNPVELIFVISPNSIKKYDYNSNMIGEYLGRLEETDYDENGDYIEMYSPRFILDDLGVNKYQNIKKRIYQMAYDRKDGNLLYVFEFDLNLGQDSGNFYFSKLGTEKYCK
jgi:DNA-directed RNA polymerase subunit N (RpoN/RPB10)